MLRDRRWQSAAAVAALFTLNSYIAFRLFLIEYLDQMWSIEGTFIGLARYVRGHFPDLNWFPLWYGGIPGQYSYPPLLPFLVAGVTAAGRTSPARAYHIVVAMFYAFGPVALFWTARRLGASRTAAFLAGVMYSLVSPSCWLIREVRGDSHGWFGPRRLVALVRYGEGPHVVCLVLITLAIGMLHVALEKRRPFYYFAAAIALAAVVLTNWIEAFALALAVLCYLISGFGDWKSRWLRIAGIGGLAYALAMPWATPATIRAIAANSPKPVGFHSSAAQGWIAAGLTIAILVLALAMVGRVAPQVRFVTLVACAMAAIALAHYWFGLDLVPQSSRYQLELDLAVCLAVGIVLDRGFNWLARMPIVQLRTAAIYAAIVACLLIAYRQHRVTRGLARPIDIHATAEYKVSRWLGENMPGARVFAPGSIGFWMNAFSDTPMLTGGFSNGTRNNLLWGVNFEIYAGASTAFAIDWLKAFGCDAIVGGDPDSREFFHDYVHPDRLHTLRELWRDGPEVIYAVPRLNRSLAHAVRPSDLPQEAPPNYYPKPLEPYLAALDDPSLPQAIFRWAGGSAASIAADLRPEHLLSIQVAWDEGWKARVNGEPRPIWGDKLGQIVVEPRCNGTCTVELLYDGGRQMRLARILSMAAFVGGLVWILLPRRRV
jgi:hypothetical protein